MTTAVADDGAVRAIRFSAAMPRLAGAPDRWFDALGRIESSGYSTVSISDHFTGGWEMEPLVAMTAAAGATSTLRILSLVLAVDYRHPVQTHKALATLDVLSGGRVEVGLGAGWSSAEYAAAGIPFLPARTRIDRLAEAVDVITRLFGDEPVTFEGRHYRIDHLDGLPKPVQRPRPPVLVGGYGDRVLTLAARVADIVGLFPRPEPGLDASAVVPSIGPAAVAEKVGIVREAAGASGRDPRQLELQLSVLAVHLVDVHESGWCSGQLAPELARSESLRDSPAVLVGTVDECTRKILDTRERLGISYFNIGGSPENAAPLVERLAGG